MDCRPDKTGLDDGPPNSIIRQPQEPICKVCGKQYPRKSDAFYQHQSRCQRAAVIAKAEGEK